MKKIWLLLLFFGHCSMTTLPKKYTRNKQSMPKKEITQKANVPLLIASNILRIGLLSYILYHKEAAANFIKRHPIISILSLGIIARYFIDSYKQNNEIKKDLHVLQMIQELYYLILYAIEISNIMSEISSEISTRNSFNEHEHFDLIVKDVPYSFEELEKLTQHILIKWHLKLKEKYPGLFPIFKSNKTTLYIQDVDDTIYFFYQDPQALYQNACSKISIKIKLLLQDILKLNIIDSL